MNKRILSLALPSIAANVTTPLLGMVDTAITGHMGGAVYIAAIAVGGVMFNMLYWLFGFLRAGTSGLCARAYGADDSEQMALVLYRSLLLGCCVGVAMIALQYPLAELLVAIVSPDPATEPLARQYFTIVIWGAPATLASFALSGWFLGMHDSKINLWISLIINITNIVISLLLVYGLGWKVGGVATGTLAAQWIGLISGSAFLGKFRPPYQSLSMVCHWEELKAFFKVNGFIMFRTVFIILTTVWFTRCGAKQGAVILAVNTMLMQLFMFFSYVMDGFAYAGEALVGGYSGGGKINQEKQCITALFRWGWGLSISFTFIYFVGGEAFLSLLSSDKEVVGASRDFWWWAVTVPLAGFAGFVWDGIYIGRTMVREMAITIMIASAIYFAIYLILFPTLGNHGLWIAFVCYLLARGISQWVLFRRNRG